MLDSIPGTLMLTDCLEQCQSNDSCSSVNYETGLCILFTSNADKLPGKQSINLRPPRFECTRVTQTTFITFENASRALHSAPNERSMGGAEKVKLLNLERPVRRAFPGESFGWVFDALDCTTPTLFHARSRKSAFEKRNERLMGVHHVRTIKLDRLRKRIKNIARGNYRHEQIEQAPGSYFTRPSRCQ